MPETVLTTAPLHSHHASESAWEAELHLGFEYREPKTVLSERRHKGPLIVQRPFYPEGDICHVYLIHPPGGIVAGDQLNIQVMVNHQARALLTTPAAGKFYRSAGKTARQVMTMQIADHASLEWLPQETIVFQGAQVEADVNIDLAEHACFIGWEVLVLGRPAAGEAFAEGEVIVNWRLSYAGRLIYLERLRLNATALAANWGLQNNPVCGTLFAFPTTDKQLLAVQSLIAEHPHRGVTQIDGLLICRALDTRADRLRGFFAQIWELLRPDVIGQAHCPPRIWAT